MKIARRRKLLGLEVIFGVLCLLGAGCSKKPPEVLAPVVQPVTTFFIESVSEVPFRRFPGEVMAGRTGRLSFDVPGRLVEFPIFEGQLVKEGDLIGQLERADFIARRDSALAQFTTAREEYQRNRTLRQRGVIAAAELDHRRRDFEVAEAALRSAQRALDDTRLVAPFEGRISQRIAENFQNVQAKELVAILEKVSTLEVDINLPERDMALAGRGITVGEARSLLEAKVEFATVPGEQFELTLESFSTRANPASRTFTVTFSFHPPEGKNILPGMTCTVLLRFREGAASTAAAADPHVYDVPVQAILTEENRTWVWRLDPRNMKVARVGVELLGLAGGSAQIRSPELSPGEELVSSGVRFLSQGMAVRRLETP
jgi:multidrug efflux system membrane fusion protein